MPKRKVLIIGYGTIGKRYHKILKKINVINKIYIFTSQKNIDKRISKFDEIKIINPDLIIISSTTNTHFRYLKKLNSLFINKKILVEKPLFLKLKKIKHIKNYVFVGYNLRLHPVIKFVKNWLKNKKVLSSEIYCGSYLPNWRKRPYHKTSSYNKQLSGGILYELSHEIDYARFLFGNLKNINSKICKVSDLKIKHNDYCNVTFKTKKNSIISINLNYYSLISKRFIILDTKKESLYADLISGAVRIKSNSLKDKNIKFNFNLEDTYKEQILLLIKNKFKELCSYFDGYETLKTIELIKNKS